MGRHSRWTEDAGLVWCSVWLLLLAQSPKSRWLYGLRFVLYMCGVYVVCVYLPIRPLISILIFIPPLNPRLLMDFQTPCKCCSVIVQSWYIRLGRHREQFHPLSLVTMMLPLPLEVAIPPTVAEYFDTKRTCIRFVH